MNVMELKRIALDLLDKYRQAETSRISETSDGVEGDMAELKRHVDGIRFRIEEAASYGRKG